MKLIRNLFASLSLNKFNPTLFGGCALFFISVVCDYVLFLLGLPGAATIFNDAIIGGVGALLILSSRKAAIQTQVVARAKERAVLVAELNHHIRDAMTGMGMSILVDDKDKRLQTFDEALAAMDFILTELAPSIGNASEPQ